MLAGIIIWTNNLIKMTEFYTNILDIQPNNRLDNHVSFHFGKLKFIIGTHEKINGKSKDKYRLMINFEVDNIHKSFDRLKSFGVKIIREPYKEHWGGFICTFQDYDDNIVQFIQHSSND
ncbi:MAG: hypothetical protein CL723_01415 [Chloroflexi bacterium]|nr:hypothetical protein [Chloroflexota bacterium]|tara:strand:- start:547 stop:903 length:357 start_codon:yes stop_codon:yes gene_type:complete